MASSPVINLFSDSVYGTLDIRLFKKKDKLVNEMSYTADNSFLADISMRSIRNRFNFLLSVCSLLYLIPTILFQGFFAEDLFANIAIIMEVFTESVNTINRFMGNYTEF